MKGNNHEKALLNFARHLRQNLPEMSEESLSQLARSLLPYLSESFYYNPSYRYDACYEIIWHCAQKMSYSAFFQAWQDATLASTDPLTIV